MSEANLSREVGADGQTISGLIQDDVGNISKRLEPELADQLAALIAECQWARPALAVAIGKVAKAKDPDFTIELLDALLRD